MTALTPSPSFGSQAEGISTNLDNGLPWPPSWDAYLSSGQTSSQVNSTQPIDEPALSKLGVDGWGPNSTFYNRLIIDPAELDMGNLLTNQTRQIGVWNGFLSNKNLEAFQQFNSEGIAVTEPVATPYVMRPLEQLNYILSISTDGPPVIDATYTWTVDGVDYSAHAIGRRVVIWPYGPSWDSPVTETLSWLTNVLRSYDGSEQRRGLRTKPRRSFSYNFKTFRHESSRMENLLWGWQNRMYALPVWTDKAKLTSAQVAGDSLINLDTATFSFSTGGLAIMYLNNKVMEVIEIEAISSGTLSLVRPLESDWPKGAIVMPVVLGHLPTNVPLMRFTSQAVVGTLTFTLDPATNDSYIPAQEPVVVYDGLEVITRQPNWKNSLSNGFDYMFDQLDQQTGAITWDSNEDFPRITRQYSWLLNGRQKIEDFRAMLGRRLGMRNAVYVPTWHDDFKVTRDMGAGDIGLTVLDNEFRLMVGADPARNHIMIRLKNGDIFYREILGVSTDGEDSVLILDSALDQAVAKDEFKSVHLLMRSRLATDQVNLVWRSGRVVEVDTSLITILE